MWITKQHNIEFLLTLSYNRSFVVFIPTIKVEFMLQRCRCMVLYVYQVVVLHFACRSCWFVWVHSLFSLSNRLKVSLLPHRRLPRCIVQLRTTRFLLCSHIGKMSNFFRSSGFTAKFRVWGRSINVNHWWSCLLQHIKIRKHWAILLKLKYILNYCLVCDHFVMGIETEILYNYIRCLL